MKNIVPILIFMFAVMSASGQIKDRFENKKEDSKQEEIREQEPEIRPSRLPSGTERKTEGKEEEHMWDRLVFGGGLSLSFGAYTYIYVAPSIGYKVRDNWIVGVGGIYSYVRYNLYFNNQLDTTLKFSMYGPKVFTNYIINDFLYVGTQFEYLSHDIPTYDPAGFVVDYRRGWTPVLFLEAGYTQPIGKKGYVQLGLRYNVLQGPDSPYGSGLLPMIGFFF